jgi:hypothetical protein
MTSPSATIIDLLAVRADRHPPGLFVPRLRPADLTGQGLAGLAEDLISVMRDENDLLAAGMPASLTRTVDRKTELADRLAAAWAAARPVPRDQAGDLIGVVERLTAMAQENVLRLEDALAASRRRIDAVLAAVGQDVAGG